MGLIHLYSATSTSFDGNGTPLVTAREAVVKRDEGFQLTFNIPISQNELHKRVQKEMIVSAMTPDGVNYFRIWDIEKRTTDVKVTALQLLYSLDVKRVNPFGGKQHTGDSILQAFVNSFKSSIAPYTFSSSILTLRDFYTNEEDDTSTSHNALAILNKITDNWSGELMLNGFDVRMISKLGTKTDALLYEHKNIASFSDSSSMNGIVTRIYATATYTPERAEGATEDPEPVVLTATVDSPLINQYAVVYEATMEYNDARTVAELRTEILKQYSEFNVDKPERTIDVDTNIVDGTAINFGDELVLKYLVHDVDELIRCVGYEYDPISENYIGVTLGTLEKTFLTKVTEGISSSVSRQFDKISRDIQSIQTAANGKNRIAYGPNPVPNAIEGDLWFYHPEGRPDEVELLIYQNGLWLPAPFLTDQDRADFDQAMTDQYDAALAEIARKDAEYKEIFDDYDEKVLVIDQGISDAKTKAQNALEEAGISTDLAQTAKDLATTAQTNASTAVSNASQAIIDASNAVLQALNAFNLATSAKSDVSTISLDVDDLAGQVALKAGQTELDTVKGTVNNHTADISANARAIEARLTSTQVSNLVDGKGLAKVTYVDNQINATAEEFGIDMTRVEGKIDGLQVGGTNLLKNTSKTFKTINTTPYYTPVDGGGVKNLSEYGLSTGDTITFRVYIKSTTGHGGMARLTLWNDAGVQVAIGGNIIQGEQEGYSTVTTTIGSDRTRLHVGVHNTVNTGVTSSILKYKEPKLEKGNKATDWSPAPEDTLMQNDFTVFKNSYQSTVDSINSELSKTAKKTDLNGMVTESVLATKQFVTQGSINTTLSDYLKTTDLNNKVKETVAYQDIKETTDRYTRVIGSTDAESRTKIAQIAMSDSVFQTTVLNKMEFDTSNVFSTKSGVGPMVNMMRLYRDGSQAPNGIAFAAAAGGGGTFRIWDIITRNGWWTVSGWVRGSQSVNGSFRIDIADGPSSPYIQIGNDNTWKYFEFSHEVKNHSSTYHFVDFSDINNLYYFIKDLKIEQNHKATPYSLAAADVATQSQVTQLSNSWALTLKSGNDIKTQINATTDGIRLASNLIYLSGHSMIDNATIKSAHIDNLNANKIVGNTAEFNTIRAGVLTTNAVSSTHINANDALFDKLFSTTSATDRLSAREAWIQSANIIGINADKITAGTISASRISTSSLANVNLGGTNLYLDSERERSSNNRFMEIYTSNILSHLVGQQITFSFDIKVGSGGTSRSLKVYRYQDSGISPSIAGTVTPTNNWVRYSFTGPVLSSPVPSGYSQGSIAFYDSVGYNNFMLRRIQIEKGNKETDWSPAPEDIVNDLKTSGRVVIHGGNITANSIDVGKITGDKASFVSAAFKALNSQSTINGHAIRIQNSAGEFVEMNNTPELRSDDAGGTAVVLGKGRVHFYDSRGYSKGYVGTDMHTAGSYDFGTFLSKGSGIYKFARMADATQTTYAYYTVKAGITSPSGIITNMVQNGYLPDGNAQQFVAKGNMLSQLNGWPNYPNWPTLTAGQQIKYKELTTQTTGDAYETIWKFGPSSQGDWRIYFAKQAVFEGGYTGTSDRRLKHDIKTTQVEALHHIESLAFKEFRWNRDNKYEPLGLIAQDSGIIRVADDDTEGLDIQRAIMLALKGTQELNKLVKAQAEKIKQLEEIINQ